MNALLEEISTRVAGGIRLSELDGMSLLASPDILATGMLADEVRRRRVADRTTFLRVAIVHLDSDWEPGWANAPGEVRLVSAPGENWQVVCEEVRRIVDSAGATPVSAFSLADLEAKAESEGRPLRSLLDALRRTGLELIADAPIDRLQNPRAALHAVNDVGLRLARCTVAKAPLTESVALFRQVAALQDATASLRSFAPLPRELSSPQPTTGYEDVKRVALARLLIDNVESIQVDWLLYGPKLAQVALTFGADDVDGVPSEGQEELGTRRVPLEEIRRNIRVAGQTPLERNGRFELVAP